MTQSPAGWHPDPHVSGQQRYWDGVQWTQQTKSEPPAAPVPTPLATEASGKLPWFRRTWVLVVIALVVGIGIGGAGASGSSDPKASSAYKDLVKNVAAADAARDKAKADLTAIAGDVPAREAAVTKAEADLAKREAADSAAEKSVAKREKAVGIVESQIRANTVSGDGIYKVGSDIKAGTYKTAGQPGCYYAVLNSTDTSNIADNNNVDGPAFVTVRNGQYLQVAGCADWVLQR